MPSFNKVSRTKNAIKTSFIGVISNLLKIIFGFVFRTIFLSVLSEVYLGINGLFSNILQILSLTDLGISSAIIYRFYKPISENDNIHVGKLMNFFKKVYLIIAAVIITLGLLILPFIKFLIKDTSEVPSDVNLYVVYLLFLANSVSTYIFSYKITLLNVDQRNYIALLFDAIITVAKYVSQICVLLITRDYTLSLLVGIVSTLVLNYLFSYWITTRYPEVFSIKDDIEQDEKKDILNDTKICMYHKIGYIVSSGTDGAVLSKTVSLSATGLYSNYSMIITHIQNLITTIIGNFTSGIGNAIHSLEASDFYLVYKRMLFMTLWISCIISCCTFVLINDLISLWVGEKYVLNSSLFLIAICIQLFIFISSITNYTFLNASGLFIKDKIRPIIEAILKISFSILLTIKLGISGVFLGTIISNLLTTFWRSPLILYRYLFKRKMFDYWIMFILFAVLSIFNTMVLSLMKSFVLKSFLFDYNLLNWILVGCISFIISNVILVICFHKSDEYAYFKEFIKNFILIFIKKIKQRNN